jgi:outer membrane protein OmpA-like peptidoglycan-associated protein
MNLDSPVTGPTMTLLRLIAPSVAVAVAVAVCASGCADISLGAPEKDPVVVSPAPVEVAALYVPQNRIARNEQRIAENARMIEELRQRGIDVRDSERGVVVNLPDVLFQTGRSQLTSSARETVLEIALVLKRAPSRHLLVEGHTDSLGDIQYNYNLSLSRAQEVARALSAEGISSTQISTRAYGETTPIASNSTEQGRRRNRRVEVIILDS